MFSSDGVTEETIVLEIWRFGKKVRELKRENWLDKLDGTGPSGLTVDFNGFLITGFDFLWLGGSGVRFWVKVGIYWILIGNLPWSGSGENNVMMLSPAQPIRYEIEQSSQGVTGQFNPICFAAISEGINQPTGSSVASETSNGPINCNSVGTEYVLCGIRQKTGVGRRSSVFIKDISISSETNDAFRWRLHLNPTLANTISWNSVSGELNEKGPGNPGNPSNSTVVSEGEILLAGNGSRFTTALSDPENVRRIASAFNGDRDELYLTCIPDSAGLDADGAINYTEL